MRKPLFAGLIGLLLIFQAVAVFALIPLLILGACIVAGAYFVAVDGCGCGGAATPSIGPSPGDTEACRQMCMEIFGDADDILTCQAGCGGGGTTGGGVVPASSGVGPFPPAPANACL
ncbi:MAG: hypothetical protein HYW50_02415 [Candidatus Diapherotrites archaeon]|nr:hypothetical protein [Candidatus Diapherotrites archaeon]